MRGKLSKMLCALLCCAMLPFGPAAASAETVTAERIPAFPGAEGGGIYTTGGRGGDVYEVTNLNDSGPGSLRDAVSAGNRTVVFQVSGTIHLLSSLRIAGSNLTIAGQTAPGDGITVADYQTTLSADNVIIRYMRFRVGDKHPSEADAFGVRGHQNFIIDHCSFSYSVDETLSPYQNKNTTVQWSIISESMLHSTHAKGNHGYGGIFGGENATFHHNLIAHHSSRNPRFAADVGQTVDFRNNVIYNWGFKSVYGGENASVNMVNNYYKFGPDTRYGFTRNLIMDPPPATSKFYLDGNYMDGSPEVTADNWSGVSNVPDGVKLSSPVPFAEQVTMQSAEDAYQAVLAVAGASLPIRDSFDARVVNDVVNRTGRILNSPKEVGGILDYASAAAPDDTDHDGMPDSWELARGLNPIDAGDGKIVGADGYTNLEHYLNSISGSGSKNPLVSVTGPAPHALIETGSQIAIQAAASDPDGSVAKVEYYANDVKIGETSAAPHSFVWNNAPEGTYYLTARTIDNTGTATSSTAVPVHVNDQGSVSPWVLNDIGTVGIPGTASLKDGVFTVKSAGLIGGSADSFSYLYQPLQGNGEIIARVDDVSPITDGTQAGVMIRASLSPDSPAAAMTASFVKLGTAGRFLARTAQGAVMTEQQVDGFAAPGWVKLVRIDNRIDALLSQDGQLWTPVGSQTFEQLPETVYYGLALDAAKTNNDINNYNASHFSNVRLQQLTPFPAAPTGLKATGGASVGLTWSPVSGATGYLVKRSSIQGGPYSVIAETNQNTSFTDSTVTVGTTYYYVVSAMNGTGEGPNSGEVSATATGTAIISILDESLEDQNIGDQPAGYQVVPDPPTSTNWVKIDAIPEGTTGNTSQKVIQLYDQGNINTKLTRSFEPQTGLVTVEVDFMQPLIAGTARPIVILDKPAGNVAVELLVASTGIQYRSASGNLTLPNSTPLTAKKWYRFQIDLDVSGKTADVYINNEFMAKIPFYSTRVASIAAIHSFTPGTGRGNHFWDNVKVYLQPAPAPRGLAATIGNEQVQLRWNAASGATSYNVKRSLTDGGPYTPIARDIAETTYIDSGLTNDTTYYYVVTANNPVGESGNSNQIAATPILLPDKPAAPASLSSVPRNAQVSLEWAAVEGATSYTLKRSTVSGGPYTNVKTNMTGNAYTDNGLANGQTYYYVVTAVNIAGESVPSQEMAATPVAPLQSPSGLQAAAGDGQATITWQPVASAESYTVKRSTVSGGPYTPVATGLSGTAYTDTSLTNGTAYYYVVSANGGGTISSNSPQVRVIPAPANGTPAAPAVNLEAGNSQVRISWTASDGALSYNVKRSAALNGSFETIAANVAGTAYTDNGVTNGTKYYYSVTSLNAKGESIGSYPAAAVPAHTIVVAKDGTGDFTTIQAAINAIPANNTKRTVIYIRNGVYREQIVVPANKPYVSFIGESATGTILVYHLNVGSKHPDGTPMSTLETVTAVVQGNDFSAENMTFQNDSGQGTGQALAGYLTGDRSVFKNVRFLGFQDTIFIAGRMYFKECYIEGDVDFIYGPATAFFENNHLHSKRRGGYITAANTDQNNPYGYVFVGAKITADEGITSGYLGRPWRAYANVVFLDSWMDAFLAGPGWHNWGNPDNELTARYAEYNTSGPGNDPAHRVNWQKQLTPEEANAYTLQQVLKGSDGWDPSEDAVIPGAPTADRTLLTELLDQADAVVADYFTDDSYAAFQTALTSAKSVAANAKATQSEVDAAADSLKSALNGLIYKIAASVDSAVPNGNGWYTVPVTVTLSTYGSAEYKLNDEVSWHSYTKPIALDQEGAFTVSYRSKNSAGTAGSVHTATANIDRTAPVTTATVSPAAPNGSSGWYTSDVTVSLSVSDNLSGAAKSEYSLDDGATWQPYLSALTIDKDGKYTVSYRSTDNAGNVETTKTIGFNLDKTAPTITVSGVVYGTYSDSMDITPIITLSDNWSGVDGSKKTFTLDTYGIQQGETIQLFTLPLGTHTFMVTSSDLAGNTSSRSVLFHTTTSIQSMQALVTHFTNVRWIDNAGIAASLQSMLKANELEAFVNFVKAESGKQISSQAAGYLVRDAQYLLSKQ
ncbi:pectinesterase family protein [Paenibacillus sp. Soil522]|uniref:pectinesterase family protein n=1 Tax=Paenibacillus sp. Soil522 TaxID=1736388 RepID=UPI0009D71992|nr:pectinesterase family protein [Paenibacillus sp. Soil522]